jgi:pimeloyl-ACP methyl ester carboxylesterase
MRGYAPTEVPADGAYHVGALAADAVVMHEALGGDGDAVLIGHDWGAEAAYGAAAFAPGRWRRLVTLAVPPAALVIEDAGHFLHLEQPGRINDHILSWVS